MSKEKKEIKELKEEDISKVNGGGRFDKKIDFLMYCNNCKKNVVLEDRQNTGVLHCVECNGTDLSAPI